MDTQELEDKISDLESTIEDRDDTISDLQSELSGKDNEISNLEDTIIELECAMEESIESKLEEIFSFYNNIWADDIKEDKLMQAIKDLKKELKY